MISLSVTFDPVRMREAGRSIYNKHVNTAQPPYSTVSALSELPAGMSHQIEGLFSLLTALSEPCLSYQQGCHIR